jgi:hypothetical protein
MEFRDMLFFHNVFFCIRCSSTPVPQQLTLVMASDRLVPYVLAPDGSVSLWAAALDTDAVCPL